MGACAHMPWRTSTNWALPTEGCRTRQPSDRPRRTAGSRPSCLTERLLWQLSRLRFYSRFPTGTAARQTCLPCRSSGPSPISRGTLRPPDLGYLTYLRPPTPSTRRSDSYGSPRSALSPARQDESNPGTDVRLSSRAGRCWSAQERLDEGCSAVEEPRR